MAWVRAKRTMIITGIIGPVVLAGAATAIVLAHHANLASCLVGTWKATSNVTTLTADHDVTVNTITGLRLSYGTDGIATLFYDDALARFNGELTELSGILTYDYRLEGSTVWYTNGRAQHESEVSQEQDYSERAECAGDRLTLTGSVTHHDESRADWTITLVRQ